MCMYACVHLYISMLFCLSFSGYILEFKVINLI